MLRNISGILRRWRLISKRAWKSQEATLHALGDIARAKGMTQVARDAGVSRESLYKALSGDCTPGFDTVLKVIAAIGMRLHPEVIPMPDHAQQEVAAAGTPLREMPAAEPSR
mgnify:FL=1